MNRSLVLKKTKYLFLLFAFLSVAAAISVVAVFGSGFAGGAMKSRFRRALGDSVSITSQEHPFSPFSQMYFSNVEIAMDGLSADVVTVRFDNSLISLLRYFIFGQGSLKIGLYDCNLNLDMSQTAAKDGSESAVVTGLGEMPQRGIPDIVDAISKTALQLRISNMNATAKAPEFDASASNLSLFLDMGRNISIRDFNLNVPSADVSSGKEGVRVCVRSMRSVEDFKIGVSGLLIESPAFGMDESDLSFKWQVGDGIGFEFPELSFSVLGHSVNADGLKADFKYSRAGSEIGLTSESIRSNISQQSQAELSDIRLAADLGDDFSIGDIRLDFDLGIRRSGKTMAYAPFSFDFKSGQGFELFSGSFVSPILSRKCVLESRLADDALNLNVRSDQSDTLSLNLVYDLKLKRIKADASIGISDLRVPESVLPFVSEKSIARADFSSDMTKNESSLGLTWSAEVFGLPFSVDLALKTNSEKVVFFGKGVEFGRLNAKPPMPLSLSQSVKKLAVPVFYSGNHAAEADVLVSDSSLSFDFKSDGGLVGVSGSIDPSDGGKRMNLDVILSGMRYGFLCALSDDGVDMTSDGFQAGIHFLNGVEAYFRANDFILPDIYEALRGNMNAGAGTSRDNEVPFEEMSSSGDRIVLNADFAFKANSREKTISMKDSSFSFAFPKFSIGWNLSYADSSFKLSNFLYASPELSFSGGGHVKADFFDKEFYKSLESYLSFKSSDGKSEIVLDVGRKDGLSIADVNVVLDPPPAFTGLSSFKLNCDLSTDWSKELSATGKASVLFFGADEECDIGISLEDGVCVFHCDEFTYKGLKACNIDLRADTITGKAIFGFDGRFDYKRLDRTVGFTFSPSIELQFDNFGAGFSLESFKNSDKEVKISFNHITMDYDKFEDLTTTARISGGKMDFSDGFIKGRADLNGKDFDFELADPFPIQGRFRGSVSNGVLQMESDIAHLPISLSRYFVIRPIFEITSGDFSGPVIIKGNLDGLDVYCMLVADEMKIWNFWTRNEYITINNVNLVGNGREIKVLRTTASSVNKSSSRVTLFEAEAGVSFDKLTYPFWNINVYVPENERVEANIPIPLFDYNISIKDVYGDFYLSGIGMDYVEISGDLFGENALFSKPMQAPKYVYADPNGDDGVIVMPKADVQVRVTTGKNVRVTYPDTNNPIVNAVLKEGQKALVIYKDSEGGKFYVDGKVEIESGDAYYLKRRFNIEKGDITWDMSRSTPDIPLINLKASYRDYDAANGGVDLYINLSNATFDLSNATFDGLKPKFTSSGGLSESEIMTKLGQAVVQTDTSSGNFQYLTSLSMTMFDLLSNISNVTQFASFVSFPEDMGVNLGLDVFALQTNFLVNFISDAAPSVLNQRTRSGGNAFSRYIDGTSLTIGKRLTPKLMLSFSAEFMNVSDMEISDKRGVGLGGDLVCRMTLGAQWDLPPFSLQFFFQPEDFSIAGFLSGYGMTITRTITF